MSKQRRSSYKVRLAFRTPESESDAPKSRFTHRATPPPPPKSWLQRHFTRRAVLIGLVEVGIAGAGIGWLLNSRPAQGASLYLENSYTESNFEALSWSHHGQFLATGDAGQVEMWDATTGDHSTIFGRHNDQVTTIGWSPDDRQLASGSRDQTIILWDAASQNQMMTYVEHKAPISALAWSPDGMRIVSAATAGPVRVWDTTGGATTQIYAGHTEAVNAVAWSPKSTLVASGDQAGKVVVWDATDGGAQVIYQGHRGAVTSLAWSPDGQQIASASQDDTVQLWDATTGTHRLTYIGQGTGVLCVAWQPSGQHLASGGYAPAVNIWDAHTGSPVFTYEEQRPIIYRNRGGGTLYSSGVPIYAVCWSPDGRFLASANGSTVQVWNAFP